ncbi:MAG: DUF3078 domain-containing protein, partial [Rhodothermales bacterium]|nr:DUF3078 domain-containing protein [Rhodothermales bacterium]
MSRRLLLAGLLGLLPVLIAPQALAQEEDPPPLTEADGWRSSLVGQLAFNQAAYRNWQEGGIDALAFTASAKGRFARVIGAFKQEHLLRTAFGLVKQDTLSFRKAEDLVRYAFNLQYTAFGALQPTLATELRTQFAPGYDYSPSAEEYPLLAEMGLVDPNDRLKISDFFAPAIWTQALGLTYDPGSWYTARVGFGAKETIVVIERLRPLYGNDLDQPVRFEAGLESLVEVRRELFENVLLESRLGVFQAFSGFEEGPDAYWENT